MELSLHSSTASPNPVHLLHDGPEPGPQLILSLPVLLHRGGLANPERLQLGKKIVFRRMNRKHRPNCLQNLDYVLVRGNSVHPPVQVDEPGPAEDAGGVALAGVLEAAVGQVAFQGRAGHAGQDRRGGIQHGFGGLAIVVVASETKEI